MSFERYFFSLEETRPIHSVQVYQDHNFLFPTPPCFYACMEDVDVNFCGRWDIGTLFQSYNFVGVLKQNIPGNPMREAPSRGVDMPLGGPASTSLSRFCEAHATGGNKTVRASMGCFLSALDESRSA